jgi:MbtH protein
VSDADDTRTYKVVFNDEEQYSIWESERPNPLGWRNAGMSGSREQCLAHIERVWSDMRPASLRRAMDEGTPNPSAWF